MAVTTDPSPGLSGVLLSALRKARGHQSGAQNAVGYVNGAEIADLAPELGCELDFAHSLPTTATGDAKTAAHGGPVFVTNRGRPTHVLLTYENYRLLAGGSASLVDLLGATPGAGEVDLPLRARNELVERRDRSSGMVLRQWLNNDVHAAFEGRILPVDVEVARTAATLHIPDPAPVSDALIAATALVHSMSVVTRDAGDFSRFNGLNVINPWRDADAGEGEGD